MAEKKFDKQKLLSVSVTVLLIFFFIGGFLLGLDRVLSMEGTFPPNEIKDGLTAAPENEKQAADYLKYVLNKTSENTACVNADVYFDINSDSVVTESTDAFRSSVLFALDNFRNHISTVEETDEYKGFVNFGEDISSILEIADTDNYTVCDFTCSYIYYQCPSCGETSDDQLPLCEKCGSMREYFKKYRDEYDIEFSLMNIAPGASESGAVLCEGFERRTDEEIAALTATVFDGAIQIDDIDIAYNDFKVRYKVNRFADEITYLCYSKNMSVSVDLTFIGKYASLGAQKISFDITENHRFDFTWAGISLNEEKLVIEPKGSDNLLATLSCENPLEMNVTWSSSDETVAVVDAEGYISTTNATGEAVITASFEYLGKTYQDSCTVYVRVPVEAMKMEKKNINLSAGEAFTLATNISPSDATVKTVSWYSEDESIATVDANGVVTAVSSGKVIVYALSDDGYFRSTCEVTVE